MLMNVISESNPGVTAIAVTDVDSVDLATVKFQMDRNRAETVTLTMSLLHRAFWAGIRSAWKTGARVAGLGS